MKATRVPTETRIATERHSAESWSGVITYAIQHFGWTEGVEVFSYTEAVDRCRLLKGRLSSIEEPSLPIEGRIFDESHEVRWVAREKGLIDSWYISDRPSLDDGTAVLRFEKHYFLIGPARNDGGFGEARYPQTFVYPVEFEAGHAAGARAYVRVHEYFSVKPVDWDSERDVELLLNTPMLVTHMFSGVGVEL